MHTVAAGGGTTVLRTATLDEPGATWATLDGVELATVAATPSIRADVHLSFAGERRSGHGRAVAARPRRLAAARPARPLRRAPCGTRRQVAQRPPDVAVVRRPGVRRRRRRRRAAPRAAAPSGSGRSTTTWRPRSSTTRSPPSTTPPTSTACSTSSASPSAAGASAATSPRSPCCAGPTSSTPPSPAHRSRSGASTTRYYTERYLGDPGERPDVYDANSLLPLADRSDPPAAADPRPRRRQRRGGAHACSCRRRCSPPAGRTRSCRSSGSPT